MPHAQRQRKPAVRRTAPKTFYAGDTIRCYQAGFPIRAGRYNEIPAETALELLAQRSAEWVNNYKAVRMFALKELRLDKSFIFTVAFMHGVSEGNAYCMRLLKTLDPRLGRKDLVCAA